MALAEKARTVLRTTAELTAIILTFPKDTTRTDAVLSAIADGSGATLGFLYGYASGNYSDAVLMGATIPTWRRLYNIGQYLQYKYSDFQQRRRF